MRRFNIQTEYSTQLADTITPVGIYLKVRDRFPNALLLESSEHSSRENSFTYICCSPIAEFSVSAGQAVATFPDKDRKTLTIERKGQVVQALNDFIDAFDYQEEEEKFITNGIFGYLNYDAVAYFEDITLNSQRVAHKDTPDILYQVFRFVLVIDHFKNRIHTYRHSISGLQDTGESMEELTTLIQNKRIPLYGFELAGSEQTNLTDDEFIDLVEKGKHHCKQGDVFQIVLSREFQQRFKGDEFNVYRALRSINPSPYLFYFDYGNYRVFGSSPEAQLSVRGNIARINPIAGTYRRTGDDAQDKALAEKLKLDQKENAEHVMLVDLARNDLSRSADHVKVDTFRDIHFYSHVIHMVSEVSGEVPPGNPTQLAADTFPAGTLSGAPKHMAMQLIDLYEPNHRGFYGGAIGFIGFNGDFNHAITIRSFLSKQNTLSFQAGAGVVVKSDARSEMQEVHNKIAALRSALKMASTI